MFDLTKLRALEPDWDGYGSEPPTEAALRTASNLTAVPLGDGGIQLELHAGGVDFEVEISGTGRVVEYYVRILHDLTNPQQRQALEQIAYVDKDETPHDLWSNRSERIAREALGLPNEQET